MSRRQRRTRQKYARHTHRRAAATGGLALAASLLSGSVAEAATTLYVKSNADTQTQSNCTPLDDCTLRDALYLASAGDTIVFNSGLSGDTITLGGSLPGFSDGALTIDGSGAPGLTVDGASNYRIFQFYTTGTVAVSNLELKNGSGAKGGAIQSIGTGALELSSMSIQSSHGISHSIGGAVYSAGPLTITDSEFLNNKNSLLDGGIDYLVGGAVAAEGALTISGSSFSGNTAGAGAAIYAYGAEPVSIDSTTISSNSTYLQDANSDGAGIYIYNAKASVMITGSTIDHNIAYSYDEEGRGAGVGIENVAASASVTITGSAIYDNTAKSYEGLAHGGGIYVGYNYGPVTVANSTIYANTAESEDAIALGGGMRFRSPHAPVTVTGATIVNNTAKSSYDDARGGGVYSSDAPAPADVPQIRDTVVSGNAVQADYSGSTASGPDLFGTFTASFSLIYDGSDATITADHDLAPGTIPYLHAFGADGTPTLNPDATTSPLVDAGKSFGLTTDQRGMTRPFDASSANATDGDGADIGAVELQPADGVTAAPAGGSPGGAPAAPIVTGIAPTSGGLGTSVSITGHNFAQTTKVLFGSTPATFTVNDFDHITAAAPAGVTGTVDITVVNTGGTSATTAADRFTYTSVTPPALIFHDRIFFGRHRHRSLHTLAEDGIVAHITCDPGPCAIRTVLRQGRHVVGRSTKTVKKGENLAVPTSLSDSGLDWLRVHPVGKNTGHLRLGVLLVDGTHILHRVGRYSFTR